MKNTFEKSLKLGNKTKITIDGVQWTLERTKFDIIRCVSENGEVINTVDIYNDNLLDTSDGSILPNLVEYIRFKSN